MWLCLSERDIIRVSYRIFGGTATASCMTMRLYKFHNQRGREGRREGGRERMLEEEERGIGGRREGVQCSR